MHPAGGRDFQGRTSQWGSHGAPEVQPAGGRRPPVCVSVPGAPHPRTSSPAPHRPRTAHAWGRCRPVPTGRERSFSGLAKRRSPSSSSSPSSLCASPRLLSPPGKVTERGTGHGAGMGDGCGAAWARGALDAWMGRGGPRRMSHRGAPTLRRSPPGRAPLAPTRGRVCPWGTAHPQRLFQNGNAERKNERKRRPRARMQRRDARPAGGNRPPRKDAP